MKTKHSILFGFYMLLAIVCTDAVAKMASDEIHLVYTQANEAFSKANKMSDDSDQAQALYQQAIAGYQKIIETGGIHNAMLYYNLGNSYLLTDDLGRAILNYRRAQYLNDSNPDIQRI